MSEPLDLGQFDGHTPGPWDWEVNLRSKDARIEQRGGRRMAVVTFERWGMQGAQPVFASPEAGGHVLHTVAELATDEDHNGYAKLTHPDARLLAAAPALLAEIKHLRELLAEARAYVVLASVQFPVAAQDMLARIDAALPKGGEGA